MKQIKNTIKLLFLLNLGAFTFLSAFGYLLIQTFIFRNFGENEFLILIIFNAILFILFGFVAEISESNKEAEEQAKRFNRPSSRSNTLNRY